MTVDIYMLVCCTCLGMYLGIEETLTGFLISPYDTKPLYAPKDTSGMEIPVQRRGGEKKQRDAAVGEVWYVIQERMVSRKTYLAT
jgi:hypothetical protein